MELLEIQEKKKALENKILNELCSFKEETGCSISDIDLQVITTRDCVERERINILRVMLKVEI